MAESTNVFIADLPSDIDDAMLAKVFGEYGTVTWSKVMPSSGKPTQAAIVEFADIAEAKWLVENIDGNIPQGLSTPVTVQFKRERRSKGFGKEDDRNGKWGGKGGKGDDGYGKWGGKGGKRDDGYGKWGGKGSSKDSKGKGYSPY
eukprot:CAMPEP_0204533268 /NCGR_PEP_ID=MMETSP0661-20131031/12184_1 /ASSEMBLY_ACC=CAM_ASM_000606 /TAXON_ID=109239 /ORGANISM="Alexandrium margalefi, Strain AMGDE01CS-322" /LENGTH=144 /DNA_ID=CAMNT_0051539597 /DNA_START=98 /DNA_END=532 /DNA_ORIENTATION=-